MTITERKRCKNALIKLVNEIGVERLCTLARVVPSTIYVWVNRGRISKKAAHLVCLSPDVASIGFTREQLRPDVKAWMMD